MAAKRLRTITSFGQAFGGLSGGQTAATTVADRLDLVGYIDQARSWTAYIEQSKGFNGRIDQGRPVEVER